MTKQAFIAQIEQIIEQKNMLKHPFYQKWNMGTLTATELQEYAKQYYHFVKNFPRMVSAVHANCENDQMRHTLLENLADEEGYKTGIANHPQLWMQFANAVGTTNEQVHAATALPQTQALVNGMFAQTKSDSFVSGIAALYGYESQVSEVSKVKIQKLKEFYGIENQKDIEFFTVHHEADIYHSQEELDMLLACCNTPDQQQQALQAVESTVNGLWGFLDGIYENYCLN